MRCARGHARRLLVSSRALRLALCASALGVAIGACGSTGAHRSAPAGGAGMAGATATSTGGSSAAGGIGAAGSGGSAQAGGTSSGGSSGTGGSAGSTGGAGGRGGSAGSTGGSGGSGGSATGGSGGSGGACVPSCAGKACGAGDGCGGVCTAGACQPGQRCVGGQCVCDAQSCAGCCNNTTCEPGTDNANCGSAGWVCAACSGGTPTCVGGTCTAACGAGTDGTCSNGYCCSGGRCVLGNTSSACGPSGTCLDCANSPSTGFACLSNGTCGCTTADDCPLQTACDTQTGQCSAQCGGPKDTDCRDGCCDATGHCVTGEANNACGTLGTCIDCTAPTCALPNNGPICHGGVCGCRDSTDCTNKAACVAAGDTVCMTQGSYCAP